MQVNGTMQQASTSSAVRAAGHDDNPLKVVVVDPPVKDWQSCLNRFWNNTLKQLSILILLVLQAGQFLAALPVFWKVGEGFVGLFDLIDPNGRRSYCLNQATCSDESDCNFAAQINILMKIHNCTLVGGVHMSGKNYVQALMCPGVTNIQSLHCIDQLPHIGQEDLWNH